MGHLSKWLFLDLILVSAYWNNNYFWNTIYYYATNKSSLINKFTLLTFYTFDELILLYSYVSTVSYVDANKGGINTHKKCCIIVAMRLIMNKFLLMITSLISFWTIFMFNSLFFKSVTHNLHSLTLSEVWCVKGSCQRWKILETSRSFSIWRW